MSALQEYRDRFAHVDMTRREGVLQLTLHTAAGGLVWGRAAHDELCEALGLVAEDAENRVILLVGAGDNLVEGVDEADPAPEPGLSGALTRAVLGVDRPLVVAVNGRAGVLSGLVALADLALASPTAVFVDVRSGEAEGEEPAAEAEAGRLPWSGRRLSAGEALHLGLVGEVVGVDLLLQRAWTQAGRLLERPPTPRRTTRKMMASAARTGLDDVAGLDVAAGLAAVALDRHHRGGREQ